MGKKKGNPFEWKVCKAFSLWATEGKRDDIFAPTVGSGARATVRAKRKESTANASGDMMFMEEDGKFLIENILFEFKRGYTKVGRVNYTKIVEEIEEIIFNESIWNLKIEDRKKEVQKISKVIKKNIQKIRSQMNKGFDLTDLIDSDGRNFLLEWIKKAEEEMNKAGRKFYMIVIRRDNKKRIVIIPYIFWFYLIGFCKLEREIRFGNFVVIRFDELMEKFSYDFFKKLVKYFERDEMKIRILSIINKIQREVK